MKNYTLIITLYVLTFSSYCQNVDFSPFKIDKTEIKGKLVLINETHNISTNNSTYYLIIKNLTSEFSSTDTLNIFIERPYSHSFLYNNILQNKDVTNKIEFSDFSQNKLSTSAWLDSLKSLKKNIRFIGVDFEYDEGKRVKSYKYFFETLKNELPNTHSSMSVLDNYIQKIDTKSIENHDVEKLKLFLKSIHPKTKFISDALFILEAKHDFWGYRDKNNFERFNEVIKNNLDVKNQYNLLIYGSNHINPTRSKNLFNLFDKDENSPFLDNTRLIANYYFGCTSYGFYASKKPLIVNEGLYETKGDEIIMTELKAKSLKNGVSVVNNNLNLPLNSFNKILYFIIHSE